MKKIYLVWLHYIWFTHKKLHKIFEHKKNYKEVFNKIDYSFLKLNNFNDNQTKFILEKYKNIKLDFLLKKLENRNVKVITFDNEDYPDNLKNIFNPPFLFYLRWEIDNSPKISIVGSRKISNYWEKVIENISPGLSKYFSIVSGWAAWCDTKAHKEALKNNSKTISIIWTWIDIDYPIENQKLFDEIVEAKGAIISIFPIEEIWSSHNFPIRNEIVAWISQWILIVEAREKSGSLITAKLGLDMWKDLFAIPWEIFKWGNIWTNNLIKNGEAKLITSSNDILEEYNISKKKESKKEKILFSDKLEEIIYNTLLLESMWIDDLWLKLNLKTIDISLKISFLEIRWIICKNLSWKYEII